MTLQHMAKEGDEVIVDPSVHPRPCSFVVACCNSKRGAFKKYRPHGIDEDGHKIFELAQLNEDYATIVSSAKKACSIVGTIVERRRYFR
jgi:SOS-response transcriptional repressor LexA